MVTATVKASCGNLRTLKTTANACQLNVTCGNKWVGSNSIVTSSVPTVFTLCPFALLSMHRGTRQHNIGKHFSHLCALAVSIRGQ
jgi:hypothetical protein